MLKRLSALVWNMLNLAENERFISLSI